MVNSICRKKSSEQRSRKGVDGNMTTFGWIAVASFLLLLPKTSAIPLLNGRFETSTDVQYLLNLALDAAAMREANSLVEKVSIYQNGIEQDSSVSGDRVTLQSLSLNAKDTMAQSPMYNIFRHAFLVLGNVDEGETQGNFDDNPIEQYGDTLVNDLFSLNINDIETEAALVTNVWMSAVHELFQVLQECKAADVSKGLGALDRVAALWIGGGQVEGSNDQGHLLYNLAENAGERFDQDDGEAVVNTQIVDRLLTMQTNLQAGSCDNDQGYKEMRGLVKETIGLMTVPLVQNLIHHSMNLQNEAGSNYVELYALATIPRVAACDPDAYDEELQLDVLRELTPDQSQAAVFSIQKAYSCLGITCAQVGSYLGGTVPECQDESTVTVVGYTTDRSGANQKVKLDRDIKQIDIFLRFEAFGAAEDWYTHGWNADGYALKNLAQNQLVPTVTDNSYISTFESYYSGEGFADNMITNMLDRVPPYNSADKEQVRKMVTGTLTNVVMFMTSATSLQYAVQQCRLDKNTALDYWDTGALFYIGSMEGKDELGSVLGGELMFAAARELCIEFGTCVGENSAAANEVIVEGFKQAINLIFEGSCEVVKGILENQILPTMIIPLIQGTIKYASFNAGLPKGTSDSSLAIGSSYALGILPIVDQSNPASAGTIMQNMEFQLSMQPVSDGFATVAEAVRTALEGMVTACSDIGEFEDEPVTGKMCSEEPAAAPENIAFGRYVFQDIGIADEAGSFALDIQAIFQASSSEAGYLIYTTGKNIKSNAASNITTLQSFSITATQTMTEDPMFNIFRYALYADDDLEGTPGEDFSYANEVTVKAFENAKDNKLAAEATVVLNVWMVMVHQLYEAVRLCGDRKDPVPTIDSAVALWIGKDQQEGKFDQGWMLYSVAQSAAKFYGLKEGEAGVNTELMDLFNEAQALGQQCTASKAALPGLYFKVHELVRMLSKPAILTLLFHLVSGSNNMLELYALSVIPQATACNEATWEVLSTALLADYSQDALTDDLIEHLASFLRCQRITKEDLEHTNAADEVFRNLLNSLIDKIDSRDSENQSRSMAGYDPKSSASEIARLDMDVLEIEIMMRAKAYTAAQEIYEQGHNAYAEDTSSRYLSMKSLSTRSDSRAELPQNMFQKYYGSEFVADDIIANAFSQTGEFVGASRGELAEIVTRTLQTMVSYDALFERMATAREVCSHESTWNATVAWDQAVALFVGSIEGPLAGGQPGGEGTFLYALANEVCAEFDNCESSGESKINEDLLIQFAAGRDAIADGNCDSLERIETTKIVPLLSTTLVQATISSVARSQNIETQDVDSNATTYIFSKAIVPLVDQSNSTSRGTIENALGTTFASISTSQPLYTIIEAFAYALRGMGIACSDVGVLVDYSDLSLCLGGETADGAAHEGNVKDQAPIAETPTDLGDGLYITTTYVQDRANIAKDVADLQGALETDSYTLAKLIYKDGKNSKTYDEKGMFESLRSLKAFSTEETKEMLDEPLFNLFMYALRNEDGKFMSRDVRLYADSIVEDAFKNINAQTKTLPVEATLALNLWMHIAHLLYKTLKDCKDKEITDEDGVHSIDVAVAYWIGDGQVAGSGDNGRLLYAMTERMAEVFNMDKGGQSRTNTNILKLFNEAKSVITLPGACSDSPSSYLHLSRLVNKISSLMAVPLIQSLIHSLRMDDRPRVKLYAHSVIPLAASCHPDAFQYLKTKLLDMTYNAVETNDIIVNLRSIYPCLGLTCSDIGVHESETEDENMRCKDTDNTTHLAGYRPHHGVGEFAILDLDIRQLDILLQMKAYAAAENLYTYGKHVESESDGSISLFQLASTNDRSVVPEYDPFVQYYGNTYEDPQLYADHVIRSALSNTGNLWDDDQRRAIVLKSVQVLVMYFGALQPMYEAVSNCATTAGSSSRRLRDVGNYWDKGAAFLIGSLEGTETNGTHNGYMFYHLAQEHCKEFGTCLPDGTSVDVNEQLLSLLYTGSGALLNDSCASLKKAVDEISTLLLIPVIQGALSSAVHLTKSNKGAEAKLHRAEAYVYSRALLPLVAASNWGAAQTLDAYLGFPEPSSPRKTVSEVFSAFAKVYPDMNVDCEQLGTIDGHNPCDGVVYEDGNAKLLWIVLGCVMGVCVLGTGVFYMRSRKKNTRLPENNPRFIIPVTGELNHSMDLLERAFSSNTKPRTESRLGESAALKEDMYNDASTGHDSDDHSTSDSSSLEVI